MQQKNELTKVNRTTESIGFPDVVLIDNISACNLKCSICDHKNMHQWRKPGKMPINIYERIVDEVATHKPNAKVWQVFYGEPFILREMPSRVAYATKKGLTNQALNSNGVLMTAEMSQELICAGLKGMYVGVDAATQQTYDKIRIGGDFHRVAVNVLTYRNLLEKHGKEGQELYVQFVVSDENEHEVEAFKEFWRREGVPVKIRPKVSWAGLVEASNLVNNCGVERRPCYWLMRTLNVCSDGRVAFCTADIHCRHTLGDLRQSTLKEIWETSARQMREWHKKSKWILLPEMCRNCRDWQSTYADFHKMETL